MQRESSSLRDQFDRARDLDALERARFLDSLQADQRALLQRLLAAADVITGEGALRVDAAELVRALEEPPAPSMPIAGQRIGSWELVALLGEGGSSTVFRAEREHAGVRQQAALKLLRRGVYTSEAQRQFRRERQALAALRHPDIAGLIEGGISDGGLAYIALELVDGTPITEHARSRALDLRARLLLFVRVCRAVESAHRALIVHRDLKPSNVLVSAEGHVKLLDFGIAKLLDADDETQTKLPAFTPAYAAPEQRSNGQVTTATDVYALGILLAELMTGRRPSGSHRTPSAQIGDSNGPGVLPASPKLTRRQVRGDLDNIVLKAIAEEPERRYTSAGAMADDIERLLDGRPVAAHPPSRWYRTQKFVQRHRVGVAISVVFLVGVFVALGLVIWQADVARREALRANAVRDFVVGVFDTARAHLPRDQRPSPEKLVAQAQQRLAKSELDDKARADVLRTLGEVSLSLANFSDAQKILQEAQALARRAGDLDGARRALVLHAKALQGAGRNDEAMREINASIAALRAAPSPDLLGALSVLIQGEMATGATDAALAHQREAVTVATGLYGSDHIERLAVSFESGETLTQAQRFPEAIAELEPALARWREAGDPEDDRYVTALASLAAASDGVGDSAKSEQRLRELLALKQRIYTPPHDAIAASLRELALIVGRDGARDAEAAALLAETLSMQQQVFGGDHAEIAETHEARGNILAAQRRFDEAETAYREALAVCERAGIRSEVCPRARNDLGMTFYRRNRLDEAEAAMQQALAERRALFGNDHPSVAYSLATLSDVALKQKKKQLGIELAAEALATMQRAGRGSSREAVLIHNSYATALWWSDRNAEALPEIEATLADWQRVAPEAKPRHVMMLVLKAQVLGELGRKDDARLTAEEAIALGVPPDRLATVTKQHLREISGRSDVYPEEAANSPKQEH